MALVRSSIDGIGPPAAPPPPRPPCPPPPGACADAGRRSASNATAPNTATPLMNVMHRFNMKVSSRRDSNPAYARSDTEGTETPYQRGGTGTRRKRVDVQESIRVLVQEGLRVLRCSVAPC